jgi:hypothetical protein
MSTHFVLLHLITVHDYFQGYQLRSKRVATSAADIFWRSARHGHGADLGEVTAVVMCGSRHDPSPVTRTQTRCVIAGRRTNHQSPVTHSSQHHASYFRLVDIFAYERQHEDHLAGFNFPTEDLEVRQFNSV